MAGRASGIDGNLRFLIAFAGSVATVVLFAWTTQAHQDEVIGRNGRAIAVLETKLEAISEKLDEIRELLMR